MTSETLKVKSKLATLSSSLDDLEARLAPLFTQSLPESIVALDPIQQAKLQTVLPYLVYDLVFIYLKSKGIDPRTHAVVPELDRVRQYFEKITNAENPATKRTAVDKAAAGRFIKRAITQAKAAARGPSDSVNASASASGPSTSPRVPVKMTSKMLERAQYEKDMRERDENESEDDELEVFVDDAVKEQNDGMAVEEDVPKVVDVKGKGKATQQSTQVGTKRRRPAIDPFAGYGDDLPEANDESASKKPKSEDFPQPAEPTPALPIGEKVRNKTPSKVARSKKRVAAALAKKNSASPGVTLPETPRTSTPGGNITDVDAVEFKEADSGRSTPSVDATLPRKARKKRSKMSLT